MTPAESRLPPHLLERASDEGSELAWSIDDIPEVIEAARVANLVSIGGQLQFRFPSATCECYWIEVDTYKSVPTSASWRERVDQTAAVATAEFSQLSKRFDFLAEGRNSFPDVFAEKEREGQDPAGAMWFVWYVQSEKESDRG